MRSHVQPRRQAELIGSAAVIALGRSDHDTARALYEQARPLYQRVGDVRGEANCIEGLGDIALACRDHGAAQALYGQARPQYQRVGDVLGEANCIKGLGDIALARSDHDTAWTFYKQALALYSRISEPYSIGMTLRRLAGMAEDKARCLLARRAEEVWRSINRLDLTAELRDEFPECFNAVAF